MLKIAIIDDNKKWISIAETQLKNLSKYSIIAKVHDGIEFVDRCYHHKIIPDIALVDVEMPKMDGVKLTDFLADFFPSIKVIAISSHCEKETIEDMIACGAYGYVSKLFEMKNLIDGIESVRKGDVYIDPILHLKGINRELLIEERKHQKEIQGDLNLSYKQKALMALYTTSASQKEIAASLSISTKSVENQVRDLSGILEVKSRQELTLKSLRKGFTRVARIFKEI